MALHEYYASQIPIAAALKDVEAFFRAFGDMKSCVVRQRQTHDAHYAVVTYTESKDRQLLGGPVTFQGARVKVRRGTGEWKSSDPSRIPRKPRALPGPGERLQPPRGNDRLDSPRRGRSRSPRGPDRRRSPGRSERKRHRDDRRGKGKRDSDKPKRRRSRDRRSRSSSSSSSSTSSGSSSYSSSSSSRSRSPKLTSKPARASNAGPDQPGALPHPQPPPPPPPPPPPAASAVATQPPTVLTAPSGTRPGATQMPPPPPPAGDKRPLLPAQNGNEPRQRPSDTAAATQQMPPSQPTALASSAQASAPQTAEMSSGLFVCVPYEYCPPDCLRNPRSFYARPYDMSCMTLFNVGPTAIPMTQAAMPMSLPPQQMHALQPQPSHQPQPGQPQPPMPSMQPQQQQQQQQTAFAVQHQQQHPQQPMQAYYTANPVYQKP